MPKRPRAWIAATRLDVAFTTAAVDEAVKGARWCSHLVYPADHGKRGECQPGYRLSHVNVGVGRLLCSRAFQIS